MDWTAFIVIVSLVCLTVVAWRVCGVAIEKYRELSATERDHFRQEIRFKLEKEKFSYLQEHGDISIEEANEE